MSGKGFRPSDYFRRVLRSLSDGSKKCDPAALPKTDTLVVVGSGFDRWLGLNTSYQDFRRYYKANHDEILKAAHTSWHELTYEDGSPFIRIDDVELLYSEPEDFYEPDFSSQILLGDWFWGDFELNLGFINATHINTYFGKEEDDLREIDECVRAADRILREAFCGWIRSIDEGIDIPRRGERLREGCFCINFNYTSTFEYVFDVPRTRSAISTARRAIGGAWCTGMHFTPGSLTALWRSLAGDSRVCTAF